MKTLEDYKKLNYRMVIDFEPDDNAYFARFPELPGCVAHGATHEEAVKSALIVKDEWLETAHESGWIIPEPTKPSEASGRITVRTPKYLHEDLISRAQQEGISLNQLLVTYLAEGLARSTTTQQFENAITTIVNRIKDRSVEVEPYEQYHKFVNSWNKVFRMRKSYGNQKSVVGLLLTPSGSPSPATTLWDMSTEVTDEPPCTIQEGLLKLAGS